MMIIAAGTEPVSLRFVHNDDQLGKEQIGMILSGRWNDAENDVDERFSDSAYDESVRIATEELETAVQEGRFDREWDELDSDEQDAVRYAIEERDDSDPVKDLLRNTRPQLMRTSLGQPPGRLQDPRFASWRHLDDGGLQAREKAVEDILKEAGVDTSAEGSRRRSPSWSARPAETGTKGSSWMSFSTRMWPMLCPPRASTATLKRARPRSWNSPGRTSC